MSYSFVVANSFVIHQQSVQFKISVYLCETLLAKTNLLLLSCDPWMSAVPSLLECQRLSTSGPLNPSTTSYHYCSTWPSSPYSCGNVWNKDTIWSYVTSSKYDPGLANVRLTAHLHYTIYNLPHTIIYTIRLYTLYNYITIGLYIIHTIRLYIIYPIRFYILYDYIHYTIIYTKQLYTLQDYI